MDPKCNNIQEILNVVYRGERDRPRHRHPRPGQDLRRHPRARRPRPHRRRGGGARLPRAQRRRQVDHHPRAARPAAHRLRLDLGVRAGPLGRQRAASTAGSPTCRATSTLWPNLSGGETIDMLLRMRGIEPRGTRREELLERFDLDPTKRGRAYSKGNRQKVALVAAFAADVDLLVLDEPTSGLDPLMEEVFADCLAERVGRGHDRAAVEPHPQRGRAARRPGHDHPGGSRRRERHPGRAAAPASQQGRGRGGRSGAGPRPDRRRERRTRGRGDSQLLGRAGGDDRRARAP